MNRYRVTGFHIVFFIFLVSNVGGCLTPIGDPPLFLGFLKGVPFWWVAGRCVIPWAVAVGALLGIFYVLDRVNFSRAPEAVRREHTTSESWAILGWHNLFFLGVVIAAVFIEHPAGVRELLMIGAAGGSYWSTPKPIHEANDFTFHPIKEVAWLFLGIFATMAPALDTLELHAPSLGLDSPLKFYAFTGVLSGVLDNAPTYLTFLAAGLGKYGLSIDQTADVAAYAAQHESELRAISLGAVFFGALTYIGNGPNFMVKAIAENAGVKMPSFFVYVGKFALPYLGLVLAMIAAIWFRR
jgi:Na+/H+ antiporter NhaD/arsenite permease-like protein